MLTGKGEKGKATVAVNSDGSGNSGDNAGIDIQLSKVGDAPAEFTYGAKLAVTALESISGLTLTPAFNANTLSYEAATTNESDTITAVAADTDSTVTILMDGAEQNGTITWKSGVNMVAIIVSNGEAWQIVKTGEKIAFVTDYNEENGYPYSNVFLSRNYLKYVQINHSKGLPFNINVETFRSCYALRRVDLKKKISGGILRYAFQNCYGLSDVSKILNEDEITSIGDQAFSSCYNLQKIVVSEDCTFGTNCFQNCYSLFPRPDGSIN